MIDKLRQMAIFAKTVDHGSFRGAASELRLSPSVVSHHISQLEESLGVALLYRSTRKLALTREGERLLAASHKMIAAVEDELQSLSATSADPSGELKVTLPSVLSNAPIMEMIAAFSEKFPRIRLSLDFSDERKEIISSGFDVAIRMAITPKRSGATRRLFNVRRLLLAAPAYLDRIGPVDTLDDLRDLQWLELDPVRNLPMRFRKKGDEAAIQRRAIHLSSNDAQSLYRLSRAGLGLTIMPEYLATADLASGRMVNLLPEWEVDPLYVMAEWPPSAPKTGLIRLLVDSLSQKEKGPAA